MKVKLKGNGEVEDSKIPDFKADLQKIKDTYGVTISCTMNSKQTFL